MKLIDDIKKALKFKSVIDAVRKSHGEGFDWSLAAKKFALNFLVVCAALFAGALADYLALPANLDLLFQWLPESVRTGARSLLEPAIAAFGFALKNWAVNRKNEIVWVVPVETPTPSVRSGETAPIVVPNAVPIQLKAKAAALGPPAPSEPLTVTNKDAGA